ncbi:MAG: cytochrome C552 [Persephonella sp.]|nr:MAG: cytochrome C552 [Persephonella sp.]
MNEETTNEEGQGTEGEQAGEEGNQTAGEEGNQEGGEKAGEEAKGGESAGGDVKKGQQLFTANGCTACHQEKADTVGPALAKIAQAYTGKKEDLIKFLKGEGKAIVDPAKFSMMEPNLAKTKGLADGDLSALADYILSIK